MCAVLVVYTMATKDHLAESEVFSVDPVYKNCITDYFVNSTNTRFNYEGRSSYEGAGGGDCIVQQED